MSDWICLIVTLPQRSGTLRMRGWRALRAAGAVVLRDGVYLLPERPACRDAMEQVAIEVRSGGGTAWLVAIDEPADAPFAPLFDRTAAHARLQAHLEHAIEALGRSTVREAERLARTLRRSVAHLATIDYFPTAQQQRSIATLDRFEQRLRVLRAPDEPSAGTQAIPRWTVAEFQGRRWATRARPWVDRLASAWLIRRFIDPAATFLWLQSPAECPPEAIGFDYDGAHVTHTGDLVTCEVLMVAFALDGHPALARVAAIVHALDVGGAAPPEAAGMERVLTGLRAGTPDDDQLLAQASAIFDALLAAFERDTQRVQDPPT